MATGRRFLLRLLSFFSAGRAEHDLRREIASHLGLLEADFIARGMSPEDARYAARRAFGGVEQVKERQRDARSFRWMNGLSLDLRLGTRMLVKYPGLTLVGGAAPNAVATSPAIVSPAHTGDHRGQHRQRHDETDRCSTTGSPPRRASPSSSHW